MSLNPSAELRNEPRPMMMFRRAAELDLLSFVVSIDVVPFPVKRNRHLLLPVIADPAAAQPDALNRRLQQPRQ